MMRLSIMMGILLLLPPGAQAQLPPFAFLSKIVSGTCAGTSMGGYCWYLGGSNVNCTTVCGSHGGYNDLGSRTYAGSDGTDAHCTALALAMTGKPFQEALPGGGGLGCVYYPLTAVAARDTDATIAGAKMSGYQRFCACNN